MTYQATLGYPPHSLSFPRGSSFGTVCALLEAKTHLCQSVASGDQLQMTLDSTDVSRTTLSGFSKSRTKTSSLEPWLVCVSRCVRPPNQKNGRAKRFSTHRPVNQSMKFSRTLRTVGLISSSPALANRPCATRSRSRGARGAHRRTRAWRLSREWGAGNEAWLGSDIFVAGSDSTDGSESAGC